MIKAAIDKILSLAPAETHKLDGAVYSDRPLNRIYRPTLNSLKVHTLTALIDYIKEVSSNEPVHPLLIHIESYKKVVLFGAPNDDCIRPVIFEAELNDFAPSFEYWYNLETFNIHLQSRFVPTNTSKQLLSLIGNATDEKIKNIGDDGITQQVVVKQGIAILGKEVVPNPVLLKPFRTFTEVEQPESQFVFRLRNNRDFIEAALFEADGGAWINEAIANIKQFLKDNLSLQDIKVNTIA